MASPITDIALSRLLNQYKSSPNWQKLVTALWERFNDLDGVLGSLRDFRGLETAEGVWLDIIGDILGVPRPPAEMPYSMVFAFKDAEDDVDDPHKGFEAIDPA